MADEKENKNFNLPGWAALLTAIAALITAFGFPSLLPELVKRFLPEPSPQSSSSSAPLAKSSTPSEKALPSLPFTSSPLPSTSDTNPSSKSTSPTEALLSLRQGMDYLKAREILLSAGWEAAKVESSEFEKSQVLARFEQSLPELHQCQGTGLGLCSGELVLEDGRTLKITVTGTRHPSLLRWDTSFHVEPMQTTLDAVKTLRSGLSYRKVREFLISEGWQSPVINPMYRAEELPSSELDFVLEFSNFQDCQVSENVIRSCSFIFFTLGERRLIITTDVTKSGSEYEPLIRTWSLQ